jgi:hypothetical protein
VLMRLQTIRAHATRVALVRVLNRQSLGLVQLSKPFDLVQLSKPFEEWRHLATLR